MHWTGQILVVLLNVVWVLFFLQPDPFSVFVQRRSSSEEMTFVEFCIQPPSTPNSTPNPAITASNTTNSTNTTTEGKERNFSLPEVHSTKWSKSPPDCRCNHTNLIPKGVESMDVKVRPPAPGCKDMIIMTSSDMEVCMDTEKYLSAINLSEKALDETTPAIYVTPEKTSSEVTTGSEMVETSTTASSVSSTTNHSKIADQPSDNQDRPRIVPGFRSKPSCLCQRVRKGLVPGAGIRNIRVYLPNYNCNRTEILITTSYRRVCLDPTSTYGEKILDVYKQKFESYYPAPLAM